MSLRDLKRGHRASAPRRRRVVAVIGSGKEADADVCRDVGRLIAELGCDLLTGAGRGTMEAVARAFCERRDELGSTALSIGIVPRNGASDGAYETKDGYPNPWIELAIYTHLPSLGRNPINVLSADAIVALPGGSGTQSEIELAQRYGVATIAYSGAPRAGPELAVDIGRVRAFLQAELGSGLDPLPPASAV